MSYSVQKHRFETDSDLLTDLGNLDIGPHETVGVVAGHFMLMYDDSADRLVPMIYQDATNPKVLDLSQKLAGDFPLRTFKLGASLVGRLLSRSISSQLALIVNDHIFQTEGWSPQNLTNKLGAGELRRSFYRQKDALPKSFMAELRSIGLDARAILDNSNAARTPTDILPKKTNLFSEQSLRNYFDQNTRQKLREAPMFDEVQQTGVKSKLMFRGATVSHTVCLTEDGACGCSGELIEFFIRLSARSFTTVVFFLPEECRLTAEAGVKAFLHIPVSLRGKLTRTCVVYGLGGMGISSASEAAIHLNIHKISPSLN